MAHAAARMVKGSGHARSDAPFTLTAGAATTAGKACSSSRHAATSAAAMSKCAREAMAWRVQLEGRRSRVPRAARTSHR